MDWKDKLNNLRSSVLQVEEENINEQHPESIATPKQTLRVELDKRNGKPATIVSEFQGSDDELKELAKALKNHCASGGSQRDGEILIQGDFRVKIAAFLQNQGYKVKKINFK